MSEALSSTVLASLELKDCSLPEYCFIQGLLFTDVIVQASYVSSVADENLKTFLSLFLLFYFLRGGAVSYTHLRAHETA